MFENKLIFIVTKIFSLTLSSDVLLGGALAVPAVLNASCLKGIDALKLTIYRIAGYFRKRNFRTSATI